MKKKQYISIFLVAMFALSQLGLAANNSSRQTKKIRQIRDSRFWFIDYNKDGLITKSEAKGFYRFYARKRYRIRNEKFHNNFVYYRTKALFEHWDKNFDHIIDYDEYVRIPEDRGGRHLEFNDGIDWRFLQKQPKPDEEEDNKPRQEWMDLSRLGSCFHQLWA